MIKSKNYIAKLNDCNKLLLDIQKDLKRFKEFEISMDYFSSIIADTFTYEESRALCEGIFELKELKEK